MTRNKSEIRLAALPEQWKRAARESDLGLWWIADDVREILGERASEEDVRTEVLRLLGPLLRSGDLVAVDLVSTKYRCWGGSVDEQLLRIDSEWRRLDAPPSIADIVWFVGPLEVETRRTVVGQFGEEEIVREWEERAQRGERLELWALASYLPADSATETPDESRIRADTLRLLKPLLEVGTLRAADPQPMGLADDRPILWEGPASAQIERIANEWQALDHPLGYGDIAQFVAVDRADEDRQPSPSISPR